MVNRHFRTDYVEFVISTKSEVPIVASGIGLRSAVAEERAHREIFSSAPRGLALISPGNGERGEREKERSAKGAATEVCDLKSCSGAGVVATEQLREAKRRGEERKRE